MDTLLELKDTVYRKSFEVEKFRRFHESILKRKSFTVKHFHFDNTTLKMAGYGPGSSLKEFLLFTFNLGEGLWNNTAFPELWNTRLQHA